MRQLVAYTPDCLPTRPSAVLNRLIGQEPSVSRTLSIPRAVSMSSWQNRPKNTDSETRRQFTVTEPHWGDQAQAFYVITVTCLTLWDSNPLPVQRKLFNLMQKHLKSQYYLLILLLLSCVRVYEYAPFDGFSLTCEDLGTCLTTHSPPVLFVCVFVEIACAH